jgi:hypothetical protein
MIAAVVVAVIVGVVLGYYSREDQVRWLRSELGTANDRLYGAWVEGAKIPSRPEPAPDAPTTEEILPDYLNPFIKRWESEEARARARAEIITMRSRGMTFDAIWLDLQRRYPDLAM